MTILKTRPDRSLGAPANRPEGRTAGTGMRGSGPGTGPGMDNATAPPVRTGRVVALTALLVGVLAVVAAAAPDAPVLLRVPAVLGFATLGLGAALFAHRPSRDPVVTWALVVVASLAGFAGGSSVLLWTQWWQPRQAALLAGAAVATSGLTALVRWARRPVPSRSPDAADRPERRRALAGHAAALLAGAGLWLAAVAGTDPAQVGEFGLLASIHPAFFAALVVCAGGFVLALRRPGNRAVVLTGYLVLLVAILHATTPLLLDQVQYAWTYKHVGVVELFLNSGAVVDSGDIYQQWPALFGGTAGVSALSGATPLSLAAWAPVFFNLAGVLVLVAIARTLSGDPRLPYLAGFLFLAINWVEEDYLAPQALAFLLGLGVLLVLLRWLRDPVRHRHRLRLRNWLTRGVGAVPVVSRQQRLLALAGLVVLFAVLTATHQLSPYVVIAQVLALTLVAGVRPIGIGVLFAGVAGLYLLPRFGVVSGSFDIFDGILHLFDNASGNAQSWGSTGQIVSAWVVRTLAVTVWALAALAVWRARRRLGTVIVPAVLAVAPFVLLAAQSYGGEAIYRVFLFSAPWCAILIAGLVLGVTRKTPDTAAPADPDTSASLDTSVDPDAAAQTGAGAVRRSRGRQALVWGLAVLALTGAALGTMQGRHGQLMVDRQTAEEVAAAEYLYANGQPGATIAVVDTNFPARLAGNYHDFNRDLPVGEPELMEGGGLAGERLDSSQVPAIEEFLGYFEGDPAYLVVSDGMRRQAEDYFGTLPEGSLDALEQALAEDPGWSEFYRNDDVVIYQTEVKG